MSKRELVDIAAEMKRETDKAFQIFDGAKTEWVTSRMSVFVTRMGFSPTG